MKDSCDGQQQCELTMVENRCYHGNLTDTEYERVQYFCINNTRSKLTLQREGGREGGREGENNRITE